ncbi:MAG: cation-translocating P-type ATPase [Candidatus Bathyarchaeota archaeon]|nr:cation-translocating P-type ATPase [Candidatus Bathyarchaeota archaeon]
METKAHEYSHEGEESWTGVIFSALILAAGLIAEFITNTILIPHLLYLAVIIYAGYPIAKSGLKALLNRNITIDILITIAAIGATAIGHLEEGASVVFLFGLAEKLEDYASDRARHAIEELIELKPLIARVRQGREEIEVPVSDVLPGEIFVARPGDRLPLDGIIIEGISSVDQAAITGESLPVSKNVGDEVYAGTINIDGFLVAEVTRVSEETMLSRIQRLIEDAEESKSPTEMFVNRFSSWYTPSVILIAVVVAVVPPVLLSQLLMDWVYKALILLVIACPCALAISTPVAMVSAIASASRNGVLVKGSKYIEQLAKTSIIAFDKTGTLTRGELEVDEVSGTDPDDVVRCAAALETQSTHPIAKAITEKSESLGLQKEAATEFKNYPGLGVQATCSGEIISVGNKRLFKELGISLESNPIIDGNGKTTIFVSRKGSVIGSLSLTDKIRLESRDSVAALKRRGIQVEMLTGDNESTAKGVAGKLGIERYKAGLLPEDKVHEVESLRREGVTVMVGDGVNDAPALAAADVGVVMGAIGSDVALETADVALMEDRIERVTYAVDLSRSAMQRIRENISLSLLVKLGIAALAMFGLVSLWVAVAVGDMGLSLAVILNSMRLGRIKPGD